MAIDAEQRVGTRALRTPGRHARAIVLRLRMRTLLALGVLAILATLAGRAFGLHSTLFLGSAVVLLGFILVVCRHLLPLVDQHDRGAAGEEHVGGLLNDLSRSWRVLHDVSFGRGDVDHIAIGPPGVFVVETKSHPGPIKVDRLHGALLRQALAQRRLVEATVGADVESLLVFSRAWIDRPLARRRGVRVLPARMLEGYLRSLPASLQEEEIDRVLAALLDAVLPFESAAGEPHGHDGRSAREPGSARESRFERDGLLGVPRIPAGARSSFPIRARRRQDRRP
jgi:Nuclease-related domain